MPDSPPQPGLLLHVVVAIAAVILLVARCKLHAFLALILVSVYLGLATGMGLLSVVRVFQEGLGAMLGSIGVVVGLGMVLGKLLADSGGAEVLASTIVHTLGERRLPWTMLLTGLVVGIAVFFTVGVVLLVPIVLALARDTRRPLLSLGIPLLAGLSVMHGLVPPHPGPMAAIGVLNANPGKVILYSLLIGVPAAVLAGPIFARFCPATVGMLRSAAGGLPSEGSVRQPPRFGITLFAVLLPVLLMLTASAADMALPSGHRMRNWLDFLGSPMVAMLIATLCAFPLLGYVHPGQHQRWLALVEESLTPAGSILLVVGAGGGFNRVLLSSGVGDAIALAASSTHLSPLLLGWAVAALIRVAAGSATVAITTAAGIVAPFAAKVPGTDMELLVIATGAGSLILSHVNDGGFWFVKEYFGLSVSETLRSWTIMETVISIAALGLVLLMSILF